MEEKRKKSTEEKEDPLFAKIKEDALSYLEEQLYNSVQNPRTPTPSKSTFNEQERTDWWEDSIFIRMKEGIREEWAKKSHNSIFKDDYDPIIPTSFKSTFNEQEKKELEYFLGEDANLLFGDDVVVVTNDLE